MDIIDETADLTPEQVETLKRLFDGKSIAIFSRQCGKTFAQARMWELIKQLEQQNGH